MAVVSREVVGDGVSRWCEESANSVLVLYSNTAGEKMEAGKRNAEQPVREALR